MRELSLLISAIIVSITDIYAINKLNKLKYNFKSSLKISLILSIIIFVNTIYVSNFLRPIIILLSFFFVQLFYYRNKIIKSIFTSFYLQMLSVIVEIIFCIIMYIMFNDIILTQWNMTTIGSLVCNISSSILLYLLILIPLIVKIHDKLLDLLDNIEKYKFLLLIISFLVSMIVLFNIFYKNYYNNRVILYIVLSAIFLLYMIIILMILYFYSRYNKITSKYNLSLESLSEYENIINKYRILNHENKNQLLMIRNMGSYAKAKKYIDEIIDNKEKDSKLVVNIVKKIPSNHLRAVFYTKLIKMENNNINFSLIVDRKISSKMFINMEDKTILDICNIVNVFLDNAIDATLKTSDKNILIELEEENCLMITISNTYSGKVNVKKLSNMGYTTKGKGHGYGLYLVKDIIKQNKDLENKIKVDEKIFTQVLKIKI